MPQLDLINLSMQFSVTLLFSWSLFSALGNLILPQYIRVNFAKKLLWFIINLLISKIKHQVYLFYMHSIFILFLLSILLKIKMSLFYISYIFFSKILLRFFLSKFRLMKVIETFFYKLISIFNFLLVKCKFFLSQFSFYIYSKKSKYLNKLNRGSKILAIFVYFEVIEYWSWDDILYLKHSI